MDTDSSVGGDAAAYTPAASHSPLASLPSSLPPLPHLLLAATLLQAIDVQLLGRLEPHQRVNKFPQSRSVLTQKQALWRTVRRLRARLQARLPAGHNEGLCDFIPPTFILPDEVSALGEWLEHEGRPVWIFKPAAASCGAGITVHDAAADAKAISVQAAADASNAKTADAVPTDAMGAGAVGSDAEAISAAPLALIPPSARTQRGIASLYISPPYLVDGFKFDLRLYVLVTSFHPLTCYTHASGIVRFATEDYASHAHDFTCARAHVCNYAVNKGSASFVRSVGGVDEADGQAGSIWSLAGFKARLQADLGTARAAKVWEDVDKLIVLTLIAAAPEMRPAPPTSAAAAAATGGTGGGGCRGGGGVSSGSSGGGVSDDDDASALDAAQRACCFQLYGFDVMLDADAKPWLLEVNGDPGLRTESPVFLEINAPMVSDLLNLVGLSAPDAGAAAASESEVAVDAGSEVTAAGAEVAAGPELAATRSKAVSSASEVVAVNGAGEASAAAAAASSAGDDTISGPGVSRVERLREEAVSRHARGKEHCGRWRRLEPSARSAEWASLLDVEVEAGR